MAPIFFFTVTAGDQTVAIDTLSTPSRLLIWSKHTDTHTHIRYKDVMYTVSAQSEWSLIFLRPSDQCHVPLFFFLSSEQLNYEVNTEQHEQWIREHKSLFPRRALKFNCYLLELIMRNGKSVFGTAKINSSHCTWLHFCLFCSKVCNFPMEAEECQEISQWSGK